LHVEGFEHCLARDMLLLQAVKPADLHCNWEVRCQEIAHPTGNMSKITEFLAMAHLEFAIGCLCVGMAKHQINVVILPGVLLVWRNIIFKSSYGTLATKTNMPLEPMYAALIITIYKPCC